MFAKHSEDLTFDESKQPAQYIPSVDFLSGISRLYIVSAQQKIADDVDYDILANSVLSDVKLLDHPCQMLVEVLLC